MHTLNRFLKAVMFKWIWLPLLLAVLVSGCLTTRNNKAISEARSPIQEFDRTLDGKGSHRILTGRLKFSHGKALMQFDKVLLGEGRYLDVESSTSGIRFGESERRWESDQKVFLIQQNACCMNDAAFRTILFLKPEESNDLAALLKRHFDLNKETGFPSGLLVMDFSNVYTFSAMHGLWQNELQLSYFVQVPGGEYNKVFGGIEWRKRSRLNLALRYAWYGITVPVDIVTGPFQLAAILLVGPGAK